MKGRVQDDIGRCEERRHPADEGTECQRHEHFRRANTRLARHAHCCREQNRASGDVVHHQREQAARQHSDRHHPPFGVAAEARQAIGQPLHHAGLFERRGDHEQPRNGTTTGRLKPASASSDVTMWPRASKTSSPTRSGGSRPLMISASAAPIANRSSFSAPDSPGVAAPNHGEGAACGT
jgi:hypothetical protein